jgi:hypothetical protein
LVLKAQIGGYDVERVFMDAGSGINLLYAKTLRVMRISLEFLKPTDCSFHGIVPGSAIPLGRIALNVCFGNRQNYRKEKLDSEVMDWPSQYHVILGRPAFLRFMVVPHYTYVVLKMPGQRGIITVKGSFELSGPRCLGLRRKISQIDPQQSSLGTSTVTIDLQDQKFSTGAQRSG